MRLTPITHTSHGGSITRQTLLTDTGEMKPMGAVAPGVYRLSTQAQQTITITQGECRVRSSDDQGWTEYESGDTFCVAGNSHVEIEVVEPLDYVCEPA